MSCSPFTRGQGIASGVPTGEAFAFVFLTFLLCHDSSSILQFFCFFFFSFNFTFFSSTSASLFLHPGPRLGSWWFRWVAMARGLFLWYVYFPCVVLFPRAFVIFVISLFFFAFYLMPAGENDATWLAGCVFIVDFLRCLPPPAEKKSFCALSLFSVPCFICSRSFPRLVLHLQHGERVCIFQERSLGRSKKETRHKIRAGE